MLMIDLNYRNMDISAYEFLQLNKILNKMVSNSLISQEEKEELLHKSGLIKLEDGSWRPTKDDPSMKTKIFLSETL